MKRLSDTEHTERVTVLLGARERRALIESAAEKALAQGRPVSLSEAARDAVRAGLRAQHRGPEAA